MAESRNKPLSYREIHDGFFPGRSFGTPVHPGFRYSDGFFKCVHVLSEAVNGRNAVYFEIIIFFRVPFERTNRTVRFEVLSEPGRMAFAFNGNILEWVPFFNKPIAAIQRVAQVC